jgi:hypothetical protein
MGGPSRRGSTQTQQAGPRQRSRLKRAPSLDVCSLQRHKSRYPRRRLSCAIVSSASCFAVLSCLGGAHLAMGLRPRPAMSSPVPRTLSRRIRARARNGSRACHCPAVHRTPWSHWIRRRTLPLIDGGVPLLRPLMFLKGQSFIAIAAALVDGGSCCQMAQQ